MIAFGQTDKGVVRGNNEDSFLVDNDHGLYVVADGMGGHSAGEVASAIAAERIGDHVVGADKGSQPFRGDYDKEYSEAANTLASGIRLAHEKILESAEGDSERRGMGTTVVAARLKEGRLAIAHVGDSRIYLQRAHSLIQLTEDHSLAAELAKKGVEIAPERNLITRALGAGVSIEVDLGDVPILDGDTLLLCSDGLHSMVDDDRIRAILDSRGDPESTSGALIDEAIRMGGSDNVTVVVVRIRKEGLLASLKRFFRIR